MVLSKEDKAIKRTQLAVEQRKQNGITEMTQDEKDKIRKTAVDNAVGQRPTHLGQTSHTVVDGCVWYN